MIVRRNQQQIADAWLAADRRPDPSAGVNQCRGQPVQQQHVDAFGNELWWLADNEVAFFRIFRRFDIFDM